MSLYVNVLLFADECLRYELYAVSNHSGMTSGGHYTAYCRGDQPFQSMRQNFSPHRHSFEDAPHKHSLLFIAHKRVTVYLHFEVKITPFSGVISKKKKKGHRQHRGQDNHTGRDDLIFFSFWRTHLKWQHISTSVIFILHMQCATSNHAMRHGWPPLAYCKNMETMLWHEFNHSK